MKKKSNSQSKDRMIHIRLDEHVHRELKILAVKNDTTIQTLVEDLIKNRLEPALRMRKDTTTGRGQG